MKRRLIEIRKTWWIGEAVTEIGVEKGPVSGVKGNRASEAEPSGRRSHGNGLTTGVGGDLR